MDATLPIASLPVTWNSDQDKQLVSIAMERLIRTCRFCLYALEENKIRMPDNQDYAIDRLVRLLEDFHQPDDIFELDDLDRLGQILLDTRTNPWITIQGPLELEVHIRLLTRIEAAYTLVRWAMENYLPLNVPVEVPTLSRYNRN